MMMRRALDGRTPLIGYPRRTPLWAALRTTTTLTNELTMGTMVIGIERMEDGPMVRQTSKEVVGIRNQ